MFLAILFAISSKWEQSRFPSKLNKLWYIHISNLLKRTNYWCMQQLQQIFRELCRVKKSQSPESDTLEIAFIWHYWNDITVELETRWVVARVKDGKRDQEKKAMWGITVMVELFYILTISLSISWLWHCTIVLQDVIIRETIWVKDTLHMSVLFLTIAHESTVISK